MRLGQDIPVNYITEQELKRRRYSKLLELQNAPYNANLGGFKVDGRLLNKILIHSNEYRRYYKRIFKGY